MFSVERGNSGVVVKDNGNSGLVIYRAKDSEFIEVDGDPKLVKDATDEEIMKSVFSRGLHLRS